MKINTWQSHPHLRMTTIITGGIILGLALRLYLPSFPSKFPNLKDIWKNIYESKARTDLKKLVITDQTVSTNDFTFYYPSGYIKDDSTSVKGAKLRTQLIARYLQPEDRDKRYYPNSITLEKILEPIDISTEDKCKLFAEDADYGVTHRFNKEAKITTCIIKFYYSSRESTYESTITEYFYKQDHGDAYKITIATDTDSFSQSATSLQESAEKFELKK